MMIKPYMSFVVSTTVFFVISILLVFGIFYGVGGVGYLYAIGISFYIFSFIRFFKKNIDFFIKYKALKFVLFFFVFSVVFCSISWLFLNGIINKIPFQYLNIYGFIFSIFILVFYFAMKTTPYIDDSHVQPIVFATIFAATASVIFMSLP